MEHLPLPRGASIDEAEKVFYIAESYDGGSFLSHPERSRFYGLYQKLTQHEWPSLGWQVTKAETLELDIFLQTWLFFGMLHEAFGDRAPVSKFVDRNHLITTARLGEIADKWIAGHRASKDREDSLLDHLIECIEKAWRTCQAVRRTTKVSSAILYSIAALCETLQDIVLGTLSSGPRTTNTTWGSLHDLKQVVETMVRNGWCPAEAVKWRAATSNFQAVYYLSKLRLHTSKDHGRCVGTVCVAGQSVYHSDASQHTSDCYSQCTAFAIDEERLMAILADGRVGVLEITIAPGTSSASASAELTIDMVPANEETKYVAISHVWADGLGNPHGNCLPMCQLIRVARFVKELQNTCSHQNGKICFWLDTLCCPVNSAYHRGLCLALMHQIYRKAAHVLILDAQLSLYDSREIDSFEICARLLFSVWSTRLWTLQEGALARRGGLWVQLRDRAVNLEALGQELILRYKTNFMDGHLTLVLSHSLTRISRFIHAGGVSAANLVDLRMAVKTRSVSVSADEPLCLATCMGIDQTNIAAAAPEDRMKEFWISMRKSEKVIPSNILFFYGDRLRDRGFRWAPVSFLDRVVFNKFWLPRRTEEVALTTNQGLQVLFPAYEIVVPINQQCEWDDILSGYDHGIPVRHTSSRWYRVFIGCHSPGPWKSLSVIEVLRRNEGRNVLLTCPGLEELTLEQGRTNSSQAISGSITSTSSDGICFSVETTVVVGLMTEYDSLIHERAWQLAQDPQLQRLCSSLVKDPSEQSVLPEHPRLSRLPNVVIAEILRLTVLAMENHHLQRSLDGAASSEVGLDYFAMCLLPLLGGWCGEVQKSWTKEQRWFVD